MAETGSPFSARYSTRPPETPRVHTTERIRPTPWTSAYLKHHMRTVPDWPAPGVQFRDITPLLQNPQVFRVLIDAFVHRYMAPDLKPTVVAGLDARGFIIAGSVVAYELGLGFVPIRKKGKLPLHHRGGNLRTGIRQAPSSCTPMR